MHFIHVSKPMNRLIHSWSHKDGYISFRNKLNFFSFMKLPTGNGAHALSVLLFSMPMTSLTSRYYNGSFHFTPIRVIIIIK